MTLTLGTLLRQDVPPVGRAAFKVTARGPLEALCRAPIGLHFWHYYDLNFS